MLCVFCELLSMNQPTTNDTHLDSTRTRRRGIVYDAKDKVTEIVVVTCENSRSRTLVIYGNRVGGCLRVVHGSSATCLCFLIFFLDSYRSESLCAIGHNEVPTLDGHRR